MNTTVSPWDTPVSHPGEELDDALQLLQGIPLVEIQPPAQQIIRDQAGGLHWVKSTAWVKFSTAFRDNMSELKGCKLAVFLCICLHVGEDGSARPGIRRICQLTGYQSAAVSKAIRDLQGPGGMMDVTRRKGATSIYRPKFVAYGHSTPLEKRNTVPPLSETLVPPLSETKEEPLRRTIKKSGAQKSRARDPLFDAICNVCQVDPATSGASIGKVKSALLNANPPYTAEEVRQFRREWWADDFRAKRGVGPTLWQLRERIGQVRVTVTGPAAEAHTYREAA